MSNTKKIEDYLPYYLGAKIKVPGQTITITHNLLADEYLMKHCGMRPFLRRVEDMECAEAIEYAKLMTVRRIPDGASVVVFKNDSGHVQVSIEAGSSSVSLFPLSIYGGNPESLRYLLSKHFDLFGLIDAGLAIDSTKQSNQ